MLIVNCMVNYYAHLDQVFSALAHPVRRAMLDRLAGGGVTVTELAEPFSMSLPAISKHVKVLERARLLERDVEGRLHHCQLAAGPMKDAAGWLEHYRAFWEHRLDALTRYLEDEEQPLTGS